MNNTFRKLSLEEGFTLIELITAMIIGTLFLFTLFTMVVSGFDSMRQAFKKTQDMADIRYWGKRLKYQLRTATTPPYETIKNTNGPGEIGGSGDYLKYQTLRKDINKFVLHKISLSGGDVVHESWYSLGNFNPPVPANPVVYPNIATTVPNESEVMLNGVTNLNFQNITVNNRNEAVEVYVTKAPLGQKNMVIKYRNKRVIPQIP
ncbi:MAG: hypothetical protein LHV68_09040 [Elusimicrobia bacterium]|nr:hypothetical protein [Candidatus Liberimonas magnetica]